MTSFSEEETVHAWRDIVGESYTHEIADAQYDYEKRSKYLKEKMTESDKICQNRVGYSSCDAQARALRVEDD